VEASGDHTIAVRNRMVQVRRSERLEIIVRLQRRRREHASASDRCRPGEDWAQIGRHARRTPPPAARGQWAKRRIVSLFRAVSPTAPGRRRAGRDGGGGQARDLRPAPDGGRLAGCFRTREAALSRPSRLHEDSRRPPKPDWSLTNATRNVDSA
jgi:hypothetical protein